MISLGVLNVFAKVITSAISHRYGYSIADKERFVKRKIYGSGEVRQSLSSFPSPFALPLVGGVWRFPSEDSSRRQAPTPGDLSEKATERRTEGEALVTVV